MWSAVCVVAVRGIKGRSGVFSGNAPRPETRAVSATSPPAPKGSAELEVSIVKLEPMTVATARAVSESPERDAWEKLRTWAELHGLFDDIEEHPVFGFNNPNPSPDRRDYGYEYWIRVDPDAAGSGEIEIKEFAGGRYAVTRCRLVGDPAGNVMKLGRSSGIGSSRANSNGDGRMNWKNSLIREPRRMKSFWICIYR